jgi:hypothetical protein
MKFRNIKNVITEDSIRAILKEENIPVDDINDYIYEFMKMDSTSNGHVTFSDLYSSMMTPIPSSWLGWIKLKFLSFFFAFLFCVFL